MDNPHLHVEIAGADWKTIIARELFYHRSCYRNITRKPYMKQDDEDDVFQQLSDEIRGEGSQWL